jgi:hypothetical protein
LAEGFDFASLGTCDSAKRRKEIRMAIQRTHPGGDHQVTYQTVELRRGRHSSPEQGACVVELASMLAGEPFSDHPKTVCPVIAAYMRALNDGLGDLERQELYGYAAAIVRTRASRRLRRARARACARWSAELGAISPFRARTLGLWGSSRALGSLCANASLTVKSNDSLPLALADALIEMGGSRKPAQPVEDRTLSTVA